MTLKKQPKKQPKQANKPLQRFAEKTKEWYEGLATILAKLIAFQKEVDERSKIQPVTPEEQKAMDEVNKKLGRGDQAGAIALLDAYHTQGIVPDVRYYQIRNSIQSVDYTPFKS
jgi:hypothetical protein